MVVAALATSRYVSHKPPVQPSVVAMHVTSLAMNVSTLADVMEAAASPVVTAATWAKTCSQVAESVASALASVLITPVVVLATAAAASATLIRRRPGVVTVEVNFEKVYARRAAAWALLWHITLASFVCRKSDCIESAKPDSTSFAAEATRVASVIVTSLALQVLEPYMSMAQT
jgi:hypothetical protein